MSLLSFAKTPDPLDLPKATDWMIPFLTSESPALEAMTDFRCAPAISVSEDTRIDDALNRMIHSGVRLLFVVDSSFTLLGAVSSHDIQGERPMLYLQSQDCNREHCSRADVTVRDVMEPLTAWRTLNIHALERATVGNIVSRFHDQSRRHIIVVETPENAASFVRGVISASFLERALGSPVETSQAAQNFAEMGRVLTR